MFSLPAPLFDMGAAMNFHVFVPEKVKQLVQMNLTTYMRSSSKKFPGIPYQGAKEGPKLTEWTNYYFGIPPNILDGLGKKLGSQKKSFYYL